MGSAEQAAQPVEQRVLRAAARLQLGVATDDEVLDAVSAEPDWDRLLELASAHGVIPLLARACGDAARDRIPEAISQRLEDEHHRIARRNLRLTKGLVDIVDRFEAAGIDALAMKGPVLAAQAYGDVALRHFGDLDLLVRPAQVVDATTVLEAAGWQREYDLSPAQTEVYVRRNTEFPLYNPDRDIWVDLHWGPLNPAMVSAVSTAEAIERASSVEVGDHRIPTLADGDRLQYLAQHGTKHGWRRLLWLLDFVAGIRRSDVDIETGLEVARGTGGERAVLLGCALASEELGVSWPAVIRRRRSAEPALEPLLRDSRRWLWSASISNTDVPISALLRYRYRAHDNRWMGLRYVVSQVVTPSLADIERVDVPAWLEPVYWGYRPLRLTRQYLLPL